MLSYARSGLYRFLEKEGENAALLFCQAGYRLKFRGTGTHGLEAHGTRGEKAMADVVEYVGHRGTTKDAIRCGSFYSGFFMGWASGFSMSCQRACWIIKGSKVVE
jgi:hypothetical protein